MTEFTDVAQDHLQVFEGIPGQYGQELEGGGSRVEALTYRLVGGLMPEA